MRNYDLKFLFENNLNKTFYILLKVQKPFCETIIQKNPDEPLKF